VASVFLGLALPSAAAAARSPKPPKPAITSFSATAIDPNYEARSLAPLVLYDTGGFIDIQATVTGATACGFSSNLAIVGLPYGAVCSAGEFTEIYLPANTGKRNLIYKLQAWVIGQGSAHSRPLSVEVSTTPNPSSITEVTPGSTWDFVSSATCSEEINTPETFNVGGTLSGPDLGTYSVVGPKVAVTFNIPFGLQDQFTFFWNPSTLEYSGTDSFFNCPWTLVPD
jgi:hypothetical protein